MILLSKYSLVVGYAIFLSTRVTITYCHDLSKKSCSVHLKTSQTKLWGDTLHLKLDKLVCTLNRALVTWRSWTSSDNEAVRVILFHEVNGNLNRIYFKHWWWAWGALSVSIYRCPAEPSFGGIWADVSMLMLLIPMSILHVFGSRLNPDVGCDMVLHRN